MRSQKKINLLQNIAITLLSVSAVLLLAQAQLSGASSGGAGDYLAGLLHTGQSSEVSASNLTGLPVSLRFAVSDTYGRYVDTAVSSADEAFAVPGGLLADALSSLSDLSTCDKADFLSALSGPSMYYEVDGALPLSILAGICGTETSQSLSSVHRALLCADGGSLALYLMESDGSCYRGSTSLDSGELSQLIDRYVLGGGFFALDLGKDFAALDPLTLFPSEQASLPVLTAASSLSDTDSLLTGLGFNPHTESRYTETGGAEVIVAGNRTLRIRPDGQLLYQSGSDPALGIFSSEDTPTAEEAAAGTCQLLASLLKSVDGGSLALTHLEQSGSRTTLEFEYLVNGVTVHFDDGAPAARVQLSGSTVDTLSLRVRQYTSGETESLLLPRLQAAAIAKNTPNALLTVHYLDSGDADVSAGWLAD